MSIYKIENCDTCGFEFELSNEDPSPFSTCCSCGLGVCDECVQSINGNDYCEYCYDDALNLARGNDK